MKFIVGVSDMHMSDNPGETIITYALGSCLGIAMYNPINGVGGLLYVMLPLSMVDSKKKQN